MAADRQTVKVMALYSIGLLGAVALVAAGEDVARSLGPAGVPVLVGIAASWALTFADQAWKRTDEAAREAHKFAAMWGAPLAMLALVVGLPFLAATVFHDPPDFTHGIDGMSRWTLVLAGVFLAGLAQGFGYLLAWTGWWLKRR
jgi:hypothetical protein